MNINVELLHLGSSVTRTWPETLEDKTAIENKIMPNQQLAKELHKPVIKRCES